MSVLVKCGERAEVFRGDVTFDVAAGELLYVLNATDKKVLGVFPSGCWTGVRHVEPAQEK